MSWSAQALLRFATIDGKRKQLRKKPRRSPSVHNAPRPRLAAPSPKT
jgi:hypothetical protein